MSTKIADVIVPEVFNPYVIERTAELSALVKCGIIVKDKELDSLALAGGRLINMPYWKDLNGDDEVLDDNGALTPGKITAGQDVAALLMRGKAWSVNDLATALSGDDPMKAIGDLVAEYWARQRQKTLLAVLKGVFASSTMSGNVHDISSLEGDLAKINGTSFIDAKTKLGDASDKLTAVAMHSTVFAELEKQNLIQYIPNSQGVVDFPSYLGRKVIVDDGCPKDGDVYTTYLFGQGAIGEGNGAAPVPTETDRDSLAGEDILINRQHFLLHPRGVKFTDSSVAKKSPSNAELANQANWNRVYENKNIRIVAFKHKI
ncbi:putative coat protein [[Clostridium] bifermentans ATCC 19299]|uniref:major capsid protein n=1 Tax=Paraclostridium bifermentans TaxID=1490 RepID=UPI00038D1954|nr:major capsid protein [Paraclostridium bifermentans]EQK46902.1 putative coat protein [[Clostridium] bifermentans ATCC 19299] [Paraclostridium bifermentans ATCC 19299]